MHLAKIGNPNTFKTRGHPPPGFRLPKLDNLPIFHRLVGKHTRHRMEFFRVNIHIQLTVEMLIWLDRCACAIGQGRDNLKKLEKSAASQLLFYITKIDIEMKKGVDSMKIGRCIMLAAIVVAVGAGPWVPVVAGPLKDEAKAAAKQTRTEIEDAKTALKASGRQVKEDAAQMGKEIKAGFKSIKNDIKKAFTGPEQEKKYRDSVACD